MGLRGNSKRKKSKRWFSSGLTLPGYNYLGPFNAEDNGPPTNPSDAAAQKHDAAYKSISQKRGFLVPYLQFSKADQDFINQASSSDYGGRWGKNYFKWKKNNLPTLNENYQLPPATKRLRGSNISPPSLKRKDPFDKPPTKKQSLRNSLAVDHTSTMSGAPKATGSGNDAGLTETPIDTVVNVTRGPPSYSFASLPFYEDRYVSNATNDYWYDQQTFRMTSPLDCKVAGAISDLNAGAGIDYAPITVIDSADASAQTARWYNFYAGIYKYYHVVSCKWHLTIENMMSEPFWVHQFYHGETMPPAIASNQDMLHWNDCESHFVGPIAHAMVTGGRETEELEENVTNEETGTLNGPQNVNWSTGDHVMSKGRSNILQLSGQYSPGDFKQEIHLDSEIENWTAIDANPLLSERLSIRVKPQWDGVPNNSVAEVNRQARFRYIFRCEYLVEFKELVTGLRYPVQQQPITVTINNTGTSL